MGAPLDAAGTPNRPEKVVVRYPAVKTTTNIRTVLNDPDVDAALIATPISSHYWLAMEALSARQAGLR